VLELGSVILGPSGTDLGAAGTVLVDGFVGPTHENGTLTLDTFRVRTYRGELLSATWSPWLFDWIRGANLSTVRLSIPGSTWSESFVALWVPVPMDNTGTFDGVVDFDGPSGETIMVPKLLREVRPIAPEHLPLFAGASVELRWEYFGTTSFKGSGHLIAQVDEHLDPARVTTRFNRPSP
jgi:hypothetical protein